MINSRKIVDVELGKFDTIGGVSWGNHDIPPNTKQGS